VRTALLLLLLAALRDERADRFFDRLKIDPPDLTEDVQRRVVVTLLDKEHWVGAYTEIANRLGPFPDNLTVTVDFKCGGPEPAVTLSRGTERRISFNIKLLAEHQKQVDEIARMKREGKKFDFKVPPMKMDRLITHEMTHVFHGACDAPKWFLEGMAQLMGDDLNSVYKFVQDERKVRGVDAEITEPEEIYARGHLFWKWLDQRSATPKTIELAFGRRVPWKKALEEATGRSWADIVAEERDWSAREIRRLR
jgi:hypothetical protein